jgi:hypothetical protein
MHVFKDSMTKFLTSKRCLNTSQACDGASWNLRPNMTGKHHYSTIRPFCIISRQFFLSSQLSTPSVWPRQHVRLAAENSRWRCFFIAILVRRTCFPLNKLVTFQPNTQGPHEDNITTTNTTDDTWGKWLYVWATQSIRHAAFFPPKEVYIIYVNLISLHRTQHIGLNYQYAPRFCKVIKLDWNSVCQKIKSDRGDYRTVKKNLNLGRTAILVKNRHPNLLQ